MSANKSSKMNKYSSGSTRKHTISNTRSALLKPSSESELESQLRSKRAKPNYESQPQGQTSVDNIKKNTASTRLATSSWLSKKSEFGASTQIGTKTRQSSKLSPQRNQPQPSSNLHSYSISQRNERRRKLEDLERANQFHRQQQAENLSNVERANCLEIVPGNDPKTLPCPHVDSIVGIFVRTKSQYGNQMMPVVPRLEYLNANPIKERDSTPRHSI